MQSIKDKYPGIDHPIILKLLEILPRKQEFLAEQKRKREEKLAFQKKVFGEGGLRPLFSAFFPTPD